MKTQKLITLLSFVMIGLFIAALAVFRFKVGTDGTEDSAPVGAPASALVTPSEVVAGNADICRYWRPWQAAFAPHKTADVMRLLFDRARQRATRTPAFKSWAGGRPKPTEDVCAVGSRAQDPADFVMDLRPAGSCAVGPDLLDFAIRMQVEPAKKYRRNAFDLKVRTDTLSAARLRGLINDQTALLQIGYTGWRDAFPEFGDAQRSALHISHTMDNLPDPAESASVKTTIHWDPQRFWQRLPLLATWVLNLGGMISFDTTVTNGKGEVIAHAVTDTRMPGTEIEVPLALGERLDLTPDTSFDLNVAHSITVNYKGLIITAKNLRYDGRLTSTGDALTYSGRFTGIEAVDISGTYKGLTALGIDDMLHKMIREAIESEVAVLTKGNGGKGWLINASLAPDPADPKSSLFSLAMELEAQVHITQLVRYESDAKAGVVLPGKGENQEFGSYVDDVLAALLRDSQRFQCD